MSYPEIYKHQIVENSELHDLVISIVNHLQHLKIPSLVLVQQYKHGDALRSRKPDYMFIRGNQARGKRRKAIQDMRDGKLDAAIATTLADEGLDIERLGAVIVAGGGKSITRVYQRVGRALRKFPGKDKALVFLFHHNRKYLDKHGARVKNILKQEGEFVVLESTPESIIGDIDDIVNPSAGLFE